MIFTPNQRRKLTNIYPYLLPKNAWTGELSPDYDYSYIHGEHDLPRGWSRLFLLYCKNIRPLLVEANYLDKFYFTQVKEKYGTMRLYNAGYPSTFNHITTIYESFSKYICQCCGKPSKIRTLGWVGFFCKKCSNNIYATKKKINKLPKYCKIEIGINGKIKKVKLPYKNLLKEYHKCIKMSGEEFYNYIINI